MSYTLKHHVKLNKTEVKYSIITVLVLAFILSFNNWGKTQFDIGYGISNLIITIVLVAVAFYAKIYAQKYFATKVGYDVEFKPWILGLILGILLIFSSRGVFVFLAVGTVLFTTIEHLRVGHKEYPISYESMGWIAILGPLTNILLAAFFKLMLVIPSINQEIVMKAIGINLWFAIFAILPIPYIENLKKILPNDGLTLMYASRWSYIFILCLVFGCAASLLFMPIMSAIIFTLIFTFLIWILYYVFYEKKF